MKFVVEYCVGYKLFDKILIDYDTAGVISLNGVIQYDPPTMKSKILIKIKNPHVDFDLTIDDITIIKVTQVTERN